MEEIPKADLHAVALLTQPWLHAPQELKVMEYKKHVHSAVPVISLTNGDTPVV